MALPWLAVIVSALCLVFAAGTSADARLVDPGIPHGENIRYDLCLGTDTSRIEERVDVNEPGGVRVYTVNSRSRDIDISIDIESAAMNVLRSVATQRDLHAVVERASQLKAKKSALNSDELGLVDFYSLVYILRGFPFDKPISLKCIMLGDKNSFPLLVKLAGRDNVTTGAGEVDCYRLTMSLTGVFGTIFPKTQLWYSVAKPHFLVKSEGPSGGPGTPKRLVVLRERWVAK
jgi:hypothetical protein